MSDFTWTRHRDGSISAKVMSGTIATRAKIEPSGNGFSAAVHGVTLTNPDALPSDGVPYGFLAKYRWPTLDAAKLAVAAVVKPR